LTIALEKRRGNLKDHMPIDVGGGQAWIAIGGLAIPLLVLSVLFFLGLELVSDFQIHGMHGAMHAESGMNPNEPDILIIGHQWWWEVHYLDGDLDQQFTTANEIHITRAPAGQHRTSVCRCHAFLLGSQSAWQSRPGPWASRFHSH